MNIVVFIIAVTLAILLYKAVSFTIARVSVYIRLCRLKKSGKIKLKFTRNPILSLFKISHAPDLIAEIGKKIYPIRFYNGIGRKHQVHFANEEYSAVFRTVGLTVMSDVGKALMGRGRAGRVGVGSNGRVRIIPELTLPKDYPQNAGKELIPIMIFAPAPSAITYVSEERSSIKTAYTGDKFYGTAVFSGPGAYDFLLREESRDSIKIK